MINTIGKKIHTLVKENTPRCHKISQECGFTQKVAFFYISRAQPESIKCKCENQHSHRLSNFIPQQMPLLSKLYLFSMKCEYSWLNENISSNA